MDHTPEPWRMQFGSIDIAGDDTYQTLWVATDETCQVLIAKCPHWDEDDKPPHQSPDVAEANAARIVACVNACAGIPDPVGTLPKLMAMLREHCQRSVVLGVCRVCAGAVDAIHAAGCPIQAAQAVLAKLETPK